MHVCTELGYLCNIIGFSVMFYLYVYVYVIYKAEKLSACLCVHLSVSWDNLSGFYLKLDLHILYIIKIGYSNSLHKGNCLYALLLLAPLKSAVTPHEYTGYMKINTLCIYVCSVHILNTLW